MNEDMVEKYQCPGCMLGSDTKCGGPRGSGVREQKPGHAPEEELPVVLRAHRHRVHHLLGDGVGRDPRKGVVMNFPSAYHWMMACTPHNPVALDLCDVRDFGAYFRSPEAAEAAADDLSAAGFSVLAGDKDVRGFPTALQDPETGLPTLRAEEVAAFEAIVARISQERRERRS